MLYQAGALKKLGRVTIRCGFMRLQLLDAPQSRIHMRKSPLPARREGRLLDTPSRDFSAEMLTLQVLDCAVLVISGTDGVQAHTETLWRRC